MKYEVGIFKLKTQTFSVFARAYDCCTWFFSSALGRFFFFRVGKKKGKFTLETLSARVEISYRRGANPRSSRLPEFSEWSDSRASLVALPLRYFGGPCAASPPKVSRQGREVAKPLRKSRPQTHSPTCTGSFFEGSVFPPLTSRPSHHRLKFRKCRRRSEPLFSRS